MSMDSKVKEESTGVEKKRLVTKKNKKAASHKGRKYCIGKTEDLPLMNEKIQEAARELLISYLLLLW